MKGKARKNLLPKRERLALIGNGGHAREAMFQIEKPVFRFVPDEFYQPGDPTLMPLSRFNPDDFFVMIAVGDPHTRKMLYQKLPEGTRFFTFIHPTVIFDRDVIIGNGSFVGAFSVITTNVQIGDHALLNRAVQIGHDSRIGNFFSAMPGAIVSGNVTIGDEVYLGTNSSIREKVEICRGVTIGLNSGVVSNITESGVYGGVPAKKIK